jgi:hypothetical protein
MEGGSARSGYFVIRIKSDILIEREYAGTRTQEKHCKRPEHSSWTSGRRASGRHQKAAH